MSELYEPGLNLEPIGSALEPVDLSQFPERLRPIVGGAVERARKELAEAFRGVTADGIVRPGLFALGRTGISVQPIIDAAETFLGSLPAEKRAAASFPIDDERAWRSWHNMHFFLMRHGCLIDELDRDRREKALALVRETLSAAGYANARDVMRLNGHVAELTGRVEEYGEFYYWISVFGKPSATEPWGWQIDGHHLSVNCFVLGDQIVVTPDFRGSEPVVAQSGKYAGTRVFEEEETKGLAFMRALGAEERRAATIGQAPPREVFAIAQCDNLVLADKGVRYVDLAAAERERLVDLIATYTGRIRPGHAEIRLTEVKEHLADTRFAWMGGVDDASPFYYRISSPVILIEFDHLPGIVYDNQEPSRRHVHTIVRTPNGNDYGRDLLSEHYRRHDHSHPATPHRQGRE